MRETNRKVTKKESNHRPTMDPMAQELRCISLATNLVEERLKNGTATSQETVHFLKMGSSTYKLEREKLQNENRLLEAKIKALETSSSSDIDYDKVIAAITEYKGIHSEDEDDD